MIDINNLIIIILQIQIPVADSLDRLIFFANYIQIMVPHISKETFREGNNYFLIQFRRDAAYVFHSLFKSTILTMRCTWDLLQIQWSL